MPVYTERQAGIYRCTYTGCKVVEFDNEAGGKDVRWVWVFQEVAKPSTSDGQIDKFTGTSMQSANSNAYKMAHGLFGRKPMPGDDTEVNAGKPYDVVYGPNQAGNLTITSVVGVREDDPRATEAEPVDLAGDLPF